jgi:ubiquinone/menaquinone biosynthesis C-methylase UbiE
MEETDSKKKGFDEGFWSKDDVKETFLEEQRQYMWNEDYFKGVLVPLFGLKKDSVILDVGCGLGFLGEKLAEFVPDGKVIGVDLDSKLIEAAKKRVTRNTRSTAFDHHVGNACDLPIESDHVDLAICQTLLMHLDEPLKAISEMKRVTKKGGRVVAIEANYSGLSFFDTAYEALNQSTDERAKLWRWNLTVNAGKKKLGKGDNEIGPKVPHLFYKSGLKVVDVRSIDRIFWLIPPYEGHELEVKHMLIPADTWIEQVGIREEFLAGGGTESEWKEFYKLLLEADKITRQQVSDETFTSSQIPAAVIAVAEKA